MVPFACASAPASHVDYQDQDTPCSAEVRLSPATLEPVVGFFINKYNREMGASVQGVNPLVLDALKTYDWPGNIRQLRNAIERAMLFADGDTLELGHFSPDIVGAFDLTLQPHYTA